uniref:Uncharacterized protein n=1 Tax=Mustela putorius furo TaxID=9669 RepID=M3YGS8_MUSPF
MILLPQHPDCKLSGLQDPRIDTSPFLILHTLYDSLHNKKYGSQCKQKSLQNNEKKNFLACLLATQETRPRM